jgi:uncharacterized membrane protein
MLLETLMSIQDNIVLAFSIPDKYKAGLLFLVDLVIIKYFVSAVFKLMSANEKREENQEAYNQALLSTVLLGASVTIVTVIFVGFGYSSLVK